ncbi:hypothetical protein, partial [Salmonella sp. s51228]|uniref:hypothetical protein n=1 Tax=Salmonella sp. s51228 TaxID=3159652 RepID=UPI0039800715
KKLKAAAIGLGCYGIITELRLKMVPNELVVTERFYWTFEEAKRQLVNRPDDWLSFEVYWWPFESVSYPDALICAATGYLWNYNYKKDKIFCQIVRRLRTEHRYDKRSKTDLYPDKISNIQNLSTIGQMLPYIIQEILLFIRTYILKNHLLEI